MHRRGLGMSDRGISAIYRLFFLPSLKSSPPSLGVRYLGDFTDFADFAKQKLLKIATCETDV